MSLLSFSGGTAPLFEFARGAEMPILSAHIISPVPPMRGTFSGLPILLKTIFNTCRFVPSIAARGIRKIADPVSGGTWTLESTLKQINNPIDQATIKRHPEMTEHMMRGVAEACYGEGAADGLAFAREGYNLAYEWAPDMPKLAKNMASKTEILCGAEDDRIPHQANE